MVAASDTHRSASTCALRVVSAACSWAVIRIDEACSPMRLISASTSLCDGRARSSASS